MTQLQHPLTVPAELVTGTLRLVDAWRRNHGDEASQAALLLAEAIAEQRFHLAYQPIVDLADGRMVALETLIRLEPAPIEGLAGAPGIIDVAERSGLIGALGFSVLATACSQLAQWREQIDTLQVHVNASPIELRDPDYLARLEQVLHATGLPPGALVVEVTETAALEREGEAQRALLGIGALGVEIALDDFGTGFASLDLLATTPANTIKLDRSFVSALDDERTRSRATVVQAAIAMARSLGLGIVGEGVETPTQARTLLSWGCQLGQGYLYGRPARAEDVDLRTTHHTSDATVARDRALSTDAVDAGMGLAMVLASTDADDGRIRADAAVVANVIASAVGSPRHRAQTAALLAAIADARRHLLRLGVDPATTRPPFSELLGALTVAPVIARDTTAGAIARTAWALATSRAAGDERPDPNLLAAHPDPTIDRELRERVDQWWDDRAPPPSPREVLLALERRLHARDDAEARLRSLVDLARAIGSSGTLEDVLEVTTGEARRVIGAASLSIGRLEVADRRLHVLVNVGELAEHEQVRPDVEYYDFDELPATFERAFQRTMHIQTHDDPDGDSGELRLLRRSGRGSSATVPIIVDGEVWGVMYATTARDAPPFTFADGPFLNAVASFVGVAIARAEDVGNLARLAHEDPLTRLPNRRRIEAYTEQLLADLSRPPIAIAMMDIDGLKVINDEFGHTVGDRVLVNVADLLASSVRNDAGAIAGRLGADEFCVVLRDGPQRARELVDEVLQRLRTTDPPQPRLSVGIASARADDQTLGDVLRRADAAQFAAKRRGVAVSTDADTEPPNGRQRRRTATPRTGRDRRRRDRNATSAPTNADALRRWATLAAGTEGDASELLECIGELTMPSLMLNRWAVGVVPAGSSSLRIERLRLRASPYTVSAAIALGADTALDLERFPLVTRAADVGLGFAIDVRDAPDATHGEYRFLERSRLTGAIGIPAPRISTEADRWILGLFFDADSVPVHDARLFVEALTTRSFGASLFGD